MRYAILGDIHANLEGLRAVLKDAAEQGVDKYVCVGDVVGYNSNPVECLEIIRNIACAVVRGNHDHYCAYDDDLSGFHPLAADVVDWTRKKLSKDDRRYLQSLEYTMPVDGFTIVHSTLDTPEMWGYVFDPLEAEANFAYQTTPVCFFGHTHVPLAFEKSNGIRSGLYKRVSVTVGKKYFINVGSVGQPRDGDPRAAYVVYDKETGEIELRRIEYDITLTQQKIIEAGLPTRVAARLGAGR